MLKVRGASKLRGPPHLQHFFLCPPLTPSFFPGWCKQHAYPPWHQHRLPRVDIHRIGTGLDH